MGGLDNSRGQELRYLLQSGPLGEHDSRGRYSHHSPQKRKTLSEQRLLEVCLSGALSTGEPGRNTSVLTGPGYDKLVSQPVAKPEMSHPS